MRNSLICYAENAGVGYKECARLNERPCPAITECASATKEWLHRMRASDCRFVAVTQNPPLPGGMRGHKPRRSNPLSRGTRQTVSTVMRGDELA
jgi:hypothetical protein